MADKISQKALNETLRNRYMSMVREALEIASGEEILITASNEFAIPCVDGNGNDTFVTIKFSVPTGSRDGEPYDGYAMAEEYKIKQTEKAEKAKANAEAKAKKIAKDEKRRASRTEENKGKA